MAQFLSDFMRHDKVKRVLAHLPQLNFITIHYSYFISMCLVTSIIFWGSSNPSKSISYTDSLFLVVSAMTEAGLNTVNLSQMTTFQQVLLWLLILMGSSIFVSISTVLTRKRVFESRLKDVLKRQKEARRMRRTSMSEVRDGPIIRKLAPSAGIGNPFGSSEFESRHSGPRDPLPGVAAETLSDAAAETTKEKAESSSSEPNNKTTENGMGNGIVEAADDPEQSTDPDYISFVRYAPSPTEPQHTRVLNFVGVGAHRNSTSRRLTFDDEAMNRRGPKKKQGGPDEPDMDHWEYPHYLNRTNTGRNAQFYGLSRAEREHLGGVEYRAITLLAYVVPLYFVLWQFFGCLGLAAYIAHNKAETSRANGINPWWLGAFNGVSAFNNSGMSLLDANMIPFQTSSYALITMGALILAGNTAYPLFLRLTLWTMLKSLCLLCPDDLQHPDLKATLRFVLQYPRRVYTNLFPSAPSMWLLFMLIVLNVIDWAAFEALNIGNSAVTSIPGDYRVLDGLFQALAVRSGGFYVIAIPSLRIGLQVLYVIMMYISAYPVVITMRHSNVYEERSLGIYADENPSDSDKELPKLGTLGRLKRTLSTTIGFPGQPMPASKTTGTDFVRQQIHGQLAHDLWWLVLAILFISCIEVSNFDRDPVTYSVFNIMFEVVSGYGCVGISTGLPNEAYSFSGGWHASSKLILCAVMLRGRHRGLPVALDRAVRLPGDRKQWGKKEEEDRVLRRSSMVGRAASIRSRSMGRVNSDGEQ